MEKREFFGIHVVKATAIIFVFYFHFFYRTGYHDVEIFGWNLYLQTFFRWLTHICSAPVFLATGFLRAETGFFQKILTAACSASFSVISCDFGHYRPAALALR